MVSIGCIVLLTAIILPASVKIRRQAQQLKCQSNVRILAIALLAYSQDFDGCFPMNITSPAPGYNWYDAGIALGVIFQCLQPPARVRFPRPADDNAIRSYGMNFWASSAIDLYYPESTRSCLWKAANPRASQMMLLAESWSGQGNQANGYYPLQTIGQAGSSEGQRFGANGGIPPWRAGHYGLVNCDLPYQRHREDGAGSGVEPHGRVTIACGDGHVEFLSDDVLVNESTGVSSGKCVWYAGDPP